MDKIASIPGDFKLDPIKIHQPFREFYKKITNLPMLVLSSDFSNQFENDSLKLLNFNLIEGMLSEKFTPDAKSLVTNEIWYFNHFISLKPLIEHVSETTQNQVILQKGAGVEWFPLVDKLLELNSIDREKILKALSKDSINPSYIKLLKNKPDSILPAEIKRIIENKLSPFFDEFKNK